jgi:hypothetical protein
VVRVVSGVTIITLVVTAARAARLRRYRMTNSRRNSGANRMAMSVPHRITQESAQRIRAHDG